MAASSKGLGKKALAAWLSWWSMNTSGALLLGESPADHAAHEQLLLEPHGHGLAKLENPSVRSRGTFPVAAELGKRLVVKSHVVQLVSS